jgi:UDP-GlcNAc:undecaprenyl-phosphate GlcNAc-1-phosphate transferase
MDAALSLTEVLMPFGAAFLLAVAVIPICRRLAISSGMVAHPRNDRWHRTTVPMMGGVGIAVAIFTTAILFGAASANPVFFSAALFIFTIGMVDDVLQVKPFTKLIGQIAVAMTLVYFDYRLGWVESRLFDSLLTVVWIVGLTNAFNLLDNMDGLCAGTALVVTVTLIIGLLTGASRDVAAAEVIYLASLAGAVTGFLVYNFPPASVFMGDSGSLLLGFSLAALTLSNEGVRGSRSDVLSAIAGPVFVLLLPIFDTTLVTVMRLLAGRSPAMGGRDHSSHRLVAIGLSERTAVFVLWLLAATGGSIGLIIRNSTQGFSVLLAGLFAIVMALFAMYLSRVRVYEEAASVPANNGVTPLPGELLYKKRVLEVMLDFCLTIGAYYQANRWYFDPEAYLANAEVFYGSLPLIVAVQLVAFFAVGVYRERLRPMHNRELLAIVLGVSLAAVIAVIAVPLLFNVTAGLTTVIAIYWTFLTAVAIASRLAERALAAIFA